MHTVERTLKHRGFPYWIDRFHVLIFFLMAITVRLPLWQAGLPLNGDESILALMGKHLSEGQAIPLYFYGQQYGFTGLETLVLALGFKLGGQGDMVFRLSLTWIWAGGLSFFYRFLKNSLQERVPLAYIWLICLTMICAPVWMRVGYASPFFFTSLLLYLLSVQRQSLILSIGMAASFVLAIASHSLWAAPLMLVLIAYIAPVYKERRWLVFIGVALALFALLYVYKSQLHDAWHPEVLDWDKLSIAGVKGLPEALWTNLTGFYYLEDVYESPVFVRAAVVCLLIMLVLAISAGFGRKTEDSFKGLRWALGLSLLGILAYALVTRKVSPRYLMPWAQFAFVFIGLGLWRLGKVISLSTLSVFLLVSMASTYAFSTYQYYTMPLQTLEELKEECATQDIRTAYCYEPLANWQIIYYTREAVQCRYTGETDRYPAYVARCDSALSAEGSAVLIARKWKIPERLPSHVLSDGEVAIYPNLTREDLTSLGFEFGDPWQDAD